MIKNKEKLIKNKRYYKLIRVKIFGIMISVLALLLLVAYFSTMQLEKLNSKLQFLAHYRIPTTNLTAKINVSVLEQELHVNRIIRFYDNNNLSHQNIDDISQELDHLKERDLLLHKKLQQTISLIEEAITVSTQEKQKIEFQSVSLSLNNIQLAYRQTYDYALSALVQLKNDKSRDSEEVHRQFMVKKAKLDNTATELLGTLEKFTTKATHDAEKYERTILHIYLLTTGIAIITGLLFAFFTATRLTRAIYNLTTGVKKIAEENYTVQIQQTSHDEIGNLSNEFNKMLNSLKMKAEIEEKFAKHIDSRMLNRIINNPDASRTGGKKEVMTVFFSNIKGFHSLLPSQSTDQSIQLKNHYYDIMTRAISKYEGVVDKFIGPTIMAFWGAPFVDTSEQCKLACLAALEQIKNTPQLETLLKRTDFDMHIGIATGSLVVGNIGSDTSKSFTVMGDTVNTASRLKGVAEQYGVPIIISEQTKKQIQGHIEIREIDLIRVVGKEEPIRVYELLGLRVDLTQNHLKCRDHFEQGLALYRQQEWEKAITFFKSCLTIKPQDQPSQLFLERIKQLKKSKLSSDWDGVCNLLGK